MLGICVSQSDTFVTKFCTVVTDFLHCYRFFALLLQIFALLLQIFALLLQIFALLSLLFGINCTEIDQSHSSIISIYIITQENIGTNSSAISQNTNTVYVELSLAPVNVQSQTHVQSMTSGIPSAQNYTNLLNISTPSEDTPTTQLPPPNTVPTVSQTICKVPNNM